MGTGAARLLPNGSLDTTFGTGGKVTLNFSALADIVRAVAIQPDDGKIVAAGLANSEPAGDIAVARFHPNGSLDTTFGTGGKVTYDISGPTGDAIRAMVLQPDGKILGAGVAGANPAIIRLNTDGSLDTTFAGGAGKAAVPIGTAGHIFALALLSTGKFLVAGFGTPTLANDFMLARFNPDGSLDATFGTGGSVLTDFNLLNDLAFAVVVQPDGRILVGGDTDAADPFGVGGDIKAGWVRYNADGSLDTTFDGDGKRQVNPTLTSDGIRGLAIQNDGKTLACGFIGEANSVTSFLDPVVGDFGVYRLNTNGTPDTSFGTGGFVRTDFGGQGDGCRAIALQTTNKIVVAGGATTNRLNFAAARYKAT
ncbi:NHL repeat-containing protein [Streptomyces lavendulae]|uniref:hypothetical protein n=1 Tax=Streptomyces lavendulae TaxID=1914 RepID=UPI0036E73283